jgi:hypothetical protein
VKHAKAANTPKRHEPNVNAPANFAPSGLIVTHPDGAYMLVKALPGGWVQASDQHKRETAYGGASHLRTKLLVGGLFVCGPPVSRRNGAPLQQTSAADRG